MKQNITAFADEFGNNSFDFKTQGSHFIIVTVICRNEKDQKDSDAMLKKHNFPKLAQTSSLCPQT